MFQRHKIREGEKKRVSFVLTSGKLRYLFFVLVNDLGRRNLDMGNTLDLRIYLCFSYF